MGGDGFTWPPQEPSDRTAPLVSIQTSPTGHAERGFEHFERVWLGVEARSFRRHAELAGWAPDEEGAACWRCGTGIGAFEADGDGCSWCRAKRLTWDRFVRVGSYDGVLRDAVLELKFERFRRTGDDLGRLLGRVIHLCLEDRRLEPSHCLLVPVPTSWRNRMRRGIDHTSVLARGASASSGVRVARILRRRHGPTQTSVPAGKRRANVRGQFLIRNGAEFEVGERGAAIILDDIRTTGATLLEACQQVRRAMKDKKSEAEIWASAVAVTPEVTRRTGTATIGGDGR